MIQDIHIDIGNSGNSASYTMPYQSYYYKNKIQFILTTDELASFGITEGQLIHAITLKASAQPSRDLSNFRIRIGQTNKTALLAWESNNLTLVYQGTVLRANLTANTSYKYDFILPYEIGTGNLLIEISRDETTGSNSGGLYTRTGLTSGRMIGWRDDSGANYPFDSVNITETLNYILDVVLSVEEAKSYKPNGTYKTPLISTNEPTRVQWQEEKASGTNIVIEYAAEQNPDVWIEIYQGEVINITRFYLKITLSTEDEKVTPVLKDLWLNPSGAPQDKLLLVMKPLNRFPTVEGDLTITYDASKGNLAGVGGAVESFTKTFTPTDLIPEPNPGIFETITAQPTITAVLTDIEYPKIYYIESDHITASPASVTVELIDASIINP